MIIFFKICVLFLFRFVMLWMLKMIFLLEFFLCSLGRVGCVMLVLYSFSCFSFVLSLFVLVKVKGFGILMIRYFLINFNLFGLVLVFLNWLVFGMWLRIWMCGCVVCWMICRSDKKMLMVMLNVRLKNMVVRRMVSMRFSLFYVWILRKKEMLWGYFLISDYVMIEIRDESIGFCKIFISIWLYENFY